MSQSEEVISHNDDQSYRRHDGAMKLQSSQPSVEVSSEEEVTEDEDDDDDDDEFEALVNNHALSPLAKKQKMASLKTGTKAVIVADAKEKLESVYEMYSSMVDQYNASIKRERIATQKLALEGKKSSSLKKKLSSAVKKYKGQLANRIEALQAKFATKSLKQMARLKKKVSDLESKNDSLTRQIAKVKHDNSVTIETEKTKRKEIEARIRERNAESSQAMHERKQQLSVETEKSKLQLKLDSKAMEQQQKTNLKMNRQGAMLGANSFNLNNAATCFAMQEQFPQGFQIPQQQVLVSPYAHPQQAQAQAQQGFMTYQLPPGYYPQSLTQAPPQHGAQVPHYATAQPTQQMMTAPTQHVLHQQLPNAPMQTSLVAQSPQYTATQNYGPPPVQFAQTTNQQPQVACFPQPPLIPQGHFDNNLRRSA